MAKRFLLPCEKCDQKLEVEARQAGRTIDCPECSSPVEVPTFRVMKTLAAVDDSEEGDAISEPNPLKGILFAAGLGLAVIAGLGGWALYNYASNMVAFNTFETDEWSQLSDETMDDATVAELWDGWLNTIDRGDLPDWQEPEWNRYYKQGQILLNVSYGIFGVAALGLLCMFGSFFLPNSNAP